MTRGCRPGFVTRGTLIERLERVRPGCAASLRGSGVPVLLGHAAHYGLVTPREYDETVPRTESTIPCYLHTYVSDPLARSAIDEYVRVGSQLYRRGSIIANICTITLCGSRHPGAGDISVPVWRPRFTGTPGAGVSEFLSLIFDPDDIRSSLLKHAFLPERWPTAGVALCPAVQAVVNAPDFQLPVLPDWRHTMSPSGWDNAINRMMTKLHGNLQIHCKARLMDAIDAYLRVVPLMPGTSAQLMIDLVSRPLRPLVMHEDDWEMAMALRTPLCEGAHNYPAQNPPFTRQLVTLHAFLVRFGVRERSYLPVVRRGRMYMYLDSKILSNLLSVARTRTKTDKKKPKSSTGGDTASETEGITTSVGELLGITPHSFNRVRRDLRQSLRKRYRAVRKHETSSVRKKRARKLEERWGRIGYSRMKLGTRIDSVESDGVGLRLCAKLPIDLSTLQVPLPGEAGPSCKSCNRKAKKGCNAMCPPAPACAHTHAPVFAALDTGRKKLFVAAVQRDATTKPESEVFSRSRYYYDMRYGASQAAEKRRLQANPAAVQALTDLSQSGGLHNCDAESWAAYLAADAQVATCLDAEYVTGVDRALWKMRMFRWKRRSLDTAVSRLLDKTTGGTHVQRPLVFAVGAAGFAATGPGELPAPTAALSMAMKRGLRRIEAQGRAVIVLTPDEFRTTMCCCACGAVTQKASVQCQARINQGEMPRRETRPSRRLRVCTECGPAVKLRDRDVQGARNILWIAVAMYYGFDRPEYLRRPHR